MSATLPPPPVPAPVAAAPATCATEAAGAAAPSPAHQPDTRPRRWWRWLWVVPPCLFFAYLNAPRFWEQPAEFGISFGYSLAYFLGLWWANNFAADLLDPYLGWDKQPLRRFVLTLSLSLLASLLVIVLITEGASVLLWHRPLGEGLRRNLGGQLVLPLLITVLISLFMHSRSFLLAWREATVRAERLEKESAVARLDSLRRQVDPHFLFNSLNALTSLVEEAEPARAVRFIRQLSSVYRYVLDNQGQELVPLAEELAFAEAYGYLQQTRLGDALRLELPAPPAAGTGLYLPPLALQLLLENALKHNAAYQAEPLRLHVALDAAAPALVVRNTLRPRRLPATEASGRGLANLRARYAFLTPRPVEAGPVGDEYVVTLPLLAL